MSARRTSVTTVMILAVLPVDIDLNARGGSGFMDSARCRAADDIADAVSVHLRLVLDDDFSETFASDFDRRPRPAAPNPIPKLLEKLC